MSHPAPTWTYTLFPTRRSSDLAPCLTTSLRIIHVTSIRPALLARSDNSSVEGLRPASIMASTARLSLRSEEHTSELQSRRDLVCRLLLEKKNRTASASFTNQTS